MLKKLWELLKETFEEWKEDKASRLAAALSYYTIFSLPGLLLIVVAVAGFFWGQEAVREDLLSQVSALVGEQGAEAVGTMLDNAGWDTDASIVATIIGVVTLLLAATGAFGQLQEALNTVWEVAPAPGASVWQVVTKRVLSFSLILGIAFLLLVSLVISAALTGLGNYLETLLPNMIWLVQILNVVISFVVITLLFALMYRYLPDVEIAWKDVLVGAALTALLFTLGKFALGVYLGQSGAASAYGAAGSLVLILLWVYYSAQILFFGAEFTQVYAGRHGSRIRPEEDAVALSEEARAEQGMPREEMVEALAHGEQPAPAGIVTTGQRPAPTGVLASMPLALPPPPRPARLVMAVRRYVPAALLFAGGVVMGLFVGPSKPERKKPRSAR